jgi:hypothetical protein
MPLIKFTWMINLFTVYRDFAIKPILPGRENVRPSTGILQKLMPAADTDGNSPYHRAVILKRYAFRQLATKDEIA